MRWIGYIYFTLAVTFVPLPLGAANLINAGPDFEKFLNAIEGQTPATVELEWMRFEAKYNPVYDEYIFQKGQPQWKVRRAIHRDEFLTQLPALKEEMKALFAEAEKIVAKHEASFRQIFPDLDDHTPVLFLPSVLTFNGKAGPMPLFGGRMGLLVGVDSIVQHKDDIDVLFSHELFHTYHQSRIQGKWAQTMATPLWTEGLGTYVSGVLNPDRDDRVLLNDDELAAACAKPEFVRELARQYLEVKPTFDISVYNDWFMLNGPTKPWRRGYCLGLQVVRRIAKSFSIAEMVKWDEARFGAKIQSVLKEIAVSK